MENKQKSKKKYRTDTIFFIDEKGNSHNYCEFCKRPITWDDKLILSCTCKGAKKYSEKLKRPQKLTYKYFKARMWWAL